MRDDLLNIFRTPALRQEVMVDAQEYFVGNPQLGIHQQIQSVRDDPFGGILDGDYAERGPALSNLLKYFADAGGRQKSRYGTKFFPRCEVRIARFDAEEGDLQRRFKGAARTDDCSEN